MEEGGGEVAEEVGRAVRMSVPEMKEVLRAMPQVDRQEVADFLRELLGPDTREVRYASDEEFEKSAAKVFEQHRELLEKLTD